jgi:hypothetical protein
MHTLMAEVAPQATGRTRPSCGAKHSAYISIPRNLASCKDVFNHVQ